MAEFTASTAIPRAATLTSGGAPSGGGSGTSGGGGGTAIDQIWRKFKQTGDELLRNRLVENYLPIVKYQAERMHRRLPSEVDIDDLVSAGVFGLMEAIDAFDLDRGVKFETYCPRRISGAILDELRSLDWAPRLVRSRATQMEQTRRKMQKQSGRLPTDEELAAVLNVDPEEFDRIRRDARRVGVTSLSRNRYQSDSDQQTHEIEFIEDHAQPDPVSVVQREDLKHALTRNLSRAERLVLILYYYEKLTMKEIGLTLDMSESRVSQLHSSIIARLKARCGHQAADLASVLSDPT